MTWSYSGDPSSSDKDAVRFLTGDTNTLDQQLQDEEINYLLVMYPTPLIAAFNAIMALAAKYARLVRQQTDEIEVYAHQKYEHYKDLADRLDTMIVAGISLVFTPFCGGISQADITTREEDTDRVGAYFKKGIHDNNESTL